MKKFFSFLIGVFIFSGLPLIGWGLNDISGFIQNPFRVAYIVMMAILSVFVVLFVPNEGRGDCKTLAWVSKFEQIQLWIVYRNMKSLIFNDLYRYC